MPGGGGGGGEGTGKGGGVQNHFIGTLETSSSRYRFNLLLNSMDSHLFNIDFN